jgi:hypothetical protein
LKPEDLTVDFSFFTAGSGGAGATLLVATFLILAEDALEVVDGRRKPVKVRAAECASLSSKEVVFHMHIRAALLSLLGNERIRIRLVRRHCR